MDHATRHISSPSPTSTFLFHHTDKSFKSLTPLLSSEVDDSVVNSCFSVNSVNDTNNLEDTSPEIHPEEDSASAADRCSGQDAHPDHHGLSLSDQLIVDSKDDSESDNNILLNHFVSTENSINHSSSSHTSLIQQISNGNSEIAVNNDDDNDDDGNEEDEEDDDEDENMRNMLSGSSRSSATSMPLLTDAHAHHSFSERISLGEYSPLSLVNDCDNALPMSPTSLALGSHHSSFKSSLNNLKIDHLGVDVVGVDVGPMVNGVDDVVGDTRSMSPSLLSSQCHNHNLWSNSSTAITQNPSLLTSTSTSIILSQNSHHSSHAMSSLMQQLEPQSIDETQHLIGHQSTSTIDSGLSHSSHLLLDRPSSEPPLNCGIDTNSMIDSKNLLSHVSASATTVKDSASLANKTPRKQSASISNSRSTSNGITSSSKSTMGSSSSSSTSSRSSGRGKVVNRGRQRNSASNTSAESTCADIETSTEAHSSKLHLQLNYQNKLKELQQRLFGPNTQIQQADNCSSDASDAPQKGKLQDQAESPSSQNTSNQSLDCIEDVDSSAYSDTIASTTDTKQSEQESNEATKPCVSSAVRQTTRRRKPTPKVSQLSKPSSGNNPKSNKSSGSTHKVVKTETAEPDTTTKNSDCLKLADLLAPNACLSSTTLASSDRGVILADGINQAGEKKIQHIQLQMDPSLTVVANNNNLIQPIIIQQVQPQQSNQDNGAISEGNSFNQHMARQQTCTYNFESLVGSQTLNRAKCNINANGDVDGNGSPVKRATGEETSLILNWPLAISTANHTNSSCNDASNNQSSNSSSTAIGPHQIAIQVICQDGTSLVLPVSSASALNSTVSLTAQGQAQLQAILTNNNGNTQQISSNLQQQNCSSQIFPVVTMISTNNQAVNQNSSTTPNSSATSSSKNAGSTSCLAASSPTLAALLDAGSSKMSNFSINVPDFQGQNLTLGNALRKVITPSVTPSQTYDNNTSITGSCNINGSIKRIKLMNNGEVSNNNGNLVQTSTVTILDPQSLIVTNGNKNNNNNNNNNKNCSDTTGRSDGNEKLTTRSDQQVATDTNSNVVQQQQQHIILSNLNNDATRSIKDKNTIDAAATKHTPAKMTSSTGNRQVDPAQPFRCEHCNSTFTRLGNFTRHKKIHTVPTKDGQRFKCDVCNKSFLQRCDLARHLHIHRGTEPHRCNICGKGYIRHSDLVTHQRFHNKEKPFGCPHCSKGFCQRGDLNRHLRSIHLQMKPILCPCCNRKFAKQETLLRHLNAAHRGNTKAIMAGSSTVQITVNDSSFQDANFATIKESIQSIETNQSGSEGVINIAVKDVGLNSDPNDTVDSKNSPSVASLQAIQATLSKVQQPPSPSKPKLRMAGAPSDETKSNMAKA